MTLPAAGWFPDPQDTTRLRWWDGRAWGEATRALPTPAVAEPIAPVVAVPTGPSFSVRTTVTESRTWAYGSGTTRRFCVTAFAAVVFAVASLALNPWGVLSVLAVIAGVIAVIRPGSTGGWRVAARSAASSAIVVAIATGCIALNEHAHLF